MNLRYKTVFESKKVNLASVEVLVVIPCLYEHLTISRVIYRLRKIFGGRVYIVVVVNHGYDPSIDKAVEAGADVILLNESRGYGLAILTGLHYLISRFPSRMPTMIIDADDTYIPPRNLPNILNAFIKASNSFLILGRRSVEKGSMPLINRIGNILINNIIRILGGLKVGDSQTGLKIFPLGLFHTLREKGMSLSGEILLNSWLYNYKIFEIPIRYTKRNSNSNSKLNVLTDGVKILWMTSTKVLLYRIWRRS